MGAALATVDQLASFMQLPLTSADPTATLLLQIASGMVRDDLKQQLDPVTDDIVELDPINGTTVRLPELPVTDVTLVEYLDSTVTPAVWTTADPSTYTVSRKTGFVTVKPWTGVCWPTDPESWRVTYSHGFAELPDSLLGVVLGVAARAYSSPASIELERLGGYQVKYAVEAEGFSALELKTLNRYKDTAGIS
jgi:hypothetical protein